MDMSQEACESKFGSDNIHFKSILSANKNHWTIIVPYRIKTFIRFSTIHSRLNFQNNEVFYHRFAHFFVEISFSSYEYLALSVSPARVVRER